MSKKLVKSEKNLQSSDKSLSEKKSKELHRPEYKMVVKEKLSPTNMIVVLIIYTLGVVFVTLKFAKESCF